MRLIILLSVACLVLPHFSTLSPTWHDFREKVIEHDMCVLIHYTSFVCNISPSKKKLGETPSYMYICHNVKCPLFFSDSDKT